MTPYEDLINTFGKPVPGKIYECKVQSFLSRRIEKIDLVCVDEDDNNWRTADDNSEIDEWNWHVIEWRLK